MLIHRRDSFRAQKALVDQVTSNRKIEVLWNTVIEEVAGADTVSGLKIRNTVTNLENALELSGLFVYVGLEPASGFVDGLLKTDNAGHIPVNVSMETEVPGVYAIGDVRQNSSSQLVSVAGDGATAAISAIRVAKIHRRRPFLQLHTVAEKARWAGLRIGAFARAEASVLTEFTAHTGLGQSR